MQEIERIIELAQKTGASDIHITEGLPVIFRICGEMQIMEELSYSGEEMKKLILEMLSEKQLGNMKMGKDADFAHSTENGDRQRVNVFREQGRYAATIRLLNNKIPSLEVLKLPSLLKNWIERPRGLILVTGPTGSGKSTTLAAMVDYINEMRYEHIITIEDPIEYVYQRKKALIHQREVGNDVESFAAALRSSLREDPDIILVGEMRDYETISAALTAAETGHLVLSTLHTTGASQTIDRIIDACPTGSQNQIRTQLSGVLCGIITQCLIPLSDKSGRIAATEVLAGTDAVLNLVRENKCHQLPSVIQSGAADGMHTLNKNLSDLVKAGMITKENAFRYSNNKKDLEQFIR